REATRERLGHRGEVVGAGDGADPEALVVVLLHSAVFPDDHRADLLGSLDVRDVVALDTVRETGQVERALELLEDQLLAVVPGEQTVLERDRRVRLGHGDELPLAPALRRQYLHPPR